MKELTIAGFGDSLTLGYGVKREIGHIYRLSKILPKNYPNIKWKIINSGINGDTTREGAYRIKKDILDFNPDIVLILYGSNDSALDFYQHRSLDEFRKNMNYIISSLLNHKTNKSFNEGIPLPIIITQPPVIDLPFMPYTTDERVREYEAVSREIANKYNLPIWDFYSYALENCNDCIEDIIALDGVHLRSKGYDLMFDFTYKNLISLLKEKNYI